MYYCWYYNGNWYFDVNKMDIWIFEFCTFCCWIFSMLSWEIKVASFIEPVLANLRNPFREHFNTKYLCSLILWFSPNFVTASISLARIVIFFLSFETTSSSFSSVIDSTLFPTRFRPDMLYFYSGQNCIAVKYWEFIICMRIDSMKINNLYLTFK